jgi:D-glycero-D-manno-heptose 1,7-bisphosphate phosphatase
MLKTKMSQHKAIFLDRDGVINKKRNDYVKTLDELEILPGIAESIKLLQDKGFIIVVVTNQSAINRNLTSHDNVQKIHDVVQKHLQSQGAHVDRFYYCPHRPDELCVCRKPKPGLLLSAAHDLQIDLSASWVIGDDVSDIMAANQAGCRGIKIGSNYDLASAVQQILNSTSD